MLLSDAVPLKSPFRRYVDLWGLCPDGMPVLTRSSHLLPVLRDGKPAMLKIARHAEERAGNALMRWWGGEGAVRVFACEGDAILMERAAGDRSLAAMARGGMDSEAVEIICSVAQKLHAGRAEPPPPLTPLARWFEPLEPAALQLGGVLRQSLETAGELLNAPVDSVVLHGDLHHGNVLDGGPRGWLAIDPKGLSGERAFDFANIFCNPDAGVATAPGRLAAQASVVAKAAGLDRHRLLRWILAYAGLSAAWSLADGDDPGLAFQIAKLAAKESGLPCAG